MLDSGLVGGGPCGSWRWVVSDKAMLEVGCAID